MAMRQRALVLVLGILLGGVIGGVAVAQFPRSPRVEVLHGYTSAVDWSGDAIGFVPLAGGEAGQGFSIAGALWSSPQRPGWGWGPSADGHPTCVSPLTHGQEIRLGIVRVAASEHAPGRTVTVWVECLGDPIGPM